MIIIKLTIRIPRSQRTVDNVNCSPPRIYIDSYV